MNRISDIRLQGVLPDAFAGSTPAASALWGADTTLRRPAAYILEAASGTGKTSLCAYLYGLRTDYAGTITFDGTDIRTLTPGAWCGLRRTSLAWMPQETHLFPELTVTDNILLKNRLTDRLSGAEIALMLERLALDGKADEKAGRLSAGQRQRVAAVRALCQPFTWLLADEPVSHLDPAANAALAALIADALTREHAGALITSVGTRPIMPPGTAAIDLSL